MNFVAVAIVSAIVFGQPVQQKSRLLIGLNCILLCLNNISQIMHNYNVHALLRIVLYCTVSAATLY